MSREERRAYQRQMKSFERSGTLPPAARARAERNAARRAARRAGSGSSGSAAEGRTFGTRFLVRTALVALAVGFLAFSLQWSEGMPRALYVGLAAAAVVLVLILGFRFVQARLQRAD